MHGIEQMTQMDILYHAMNYTSKGTVDAASRRDFIEGRVQRKPHILLRS